MFNLRRLLVLALALTFVLGGVAWAQEPLAADKPGQAVCDVGNAKFEWENESWGEEYNDDSVASFSGNAQEFCWTLADGYCLSSVCAKAGTELNYWNYSGDEGKNGCISAWSQSDGKTRDLSHVVLHTYQCVEECEWCSPGYWKNHLGSWTAEEQGTLYSSVFGFPKLSPNGVKSKAPTDPTMLEVVSNPQWYGGSATENVADWLSEKYLDNYCPGERPDYCPLN